MRLLPLQQTQQQKQQRQQKTFWCQPQVNFEHGSQMCTTACMQVGMALLSGQLHLGSEEGAHRRGEGEEEDERNSEQRISRVLDWCMDAGSVVHGRVSALVEMRDTGGETKRRHHHDHHHHHHHRNRGSSRMVSANELVSLLGIDLPKLGVGTEELVVCRQGLRTRLVEREIDADESKIVLRYEPESCYVSLAHLPRCMEVFASHEKKRARVVVALVTANHHTVCAACYGGGGGCGGGTEKEEESYYAVFDPMPGQLCTGLSGGEMVARVQRMLRFPAALVHGVDVEVVKNAKVPRSVDEKKGMEMDENLTDEELCFYGDVTLMYVNK